MYFVLLTLLFFLMILEGVTRHLKGFRSLLFLTSSSLFFVLLAFNDWSPDLNSYQIHFYNYQDDFIISNVEVINLLLIRLANEFGLGFEEYQFCLAVLILLPFIITLYKFSPLPIFVLFNFYFIPFWPDIVQVRSFLAFSIFFLALYYIYSKKFIFIILFIVSCLTHYSFLVFIIFLAIKKYAFFSDYKKSTLIILIGIVLLFFIPKSITEPMIVMLNPKYLNYLEADVSFIGTVVLFLPFFIFNNIILSFHSKYYKNIEYAVQSKYKKFVPLLLQLTQFSNYMIFFQYFIRDFSRITMNLHVFPVIYVTIISTVYLTKGSNGIKYNRYKIVAVFFTLCCFYVNFLMLNMGEYMNVILKTFNSNSLLP